MRDLPLFRPHPVQIQLWNSKARFRVVPAGRRSGKTALAKRFLIRRAVNALDEIGHLQPPYNFFAAAPIRDQAKRIYWQDLKAMIPSEFMDGRPSESELTIHLINGASLTVVGMDKPERIEGTPWDGGILDEYANMKAHAWGANVRPALSDRHGWCWLIGVPEGRNHYYETYVRALADDTGEWAGFTWKSVDILPPEEVEAARRDLDELTFSQEYEACHALDTLIVLESGDVKKICEVKRGDIVVSLQNGCLKKYTVTASCATGVKKMMQVTLENGLKFKASKDHKMRVGGNRIELSKCTELDIVFRPSRPKSKDSALAAVIGFNLGDGTVCDRGGRYQAAFYSNDKEALERLAEDIVFAGIPVPGVPSVIEKRGPVGSNPHYQIQLNGTASRFIVEHGAVVGKKKDSIFGIPPWICTSGDDVKKSFLAALFGAEGNVPRIAKHGKGIGSLVISMMARQLLIEVKDMLGVLGIKSSFKPRNDGMCSVYVEKKFINKIGYLYCTDKERLSWLVSNYYKCSKAIHRECFNLRLDGMTWKQIGESLGIKHLTARQYGISPDTERVPSWFPSFEEWKLKRFVGGALSVGVVHAEEYPEEPVWNITVESPDHSYILGNGLDNFNCFINFEGRAYYPFTLESHTAALRHLYDNRQPLFFCFDFNVAPGVAAVCQELPLPSGQTGTAVIGEVYIPRNSNTPAVCRKLIADWGTHQGRIVCYGDATGGSKGSAKVQGSDWDLIRSEFRSSPFSDRVSYRVPSANPAERARVNAVNSRLKNHAEEIRLMVDPKHAPHVVKDLDGVALLKGGSGEIDKKGDPDLTHISDALGYYIIQEFPTTKRTFSAQQPTGGRRV